MKAILPNFAGFYHTRFEVMLENEYEQVMESDCPMESEPDWQAGQLAISKGIISAFNQETGLNLSFLELISPKEYNFTADKILVEIPDAEWRKIKNEVYQNVELDGRGGYLVSTIEELFTQRDGFIPFYSNKLEEWENKEEFDEVEAMTILQAWFELKGFEWDYADDKPCVYESAAAIWS